MPNRFFALAVEIPHAVRPRHKLIARNVRLFSAARFLPTLFVQNDNHFDGRDHERRGRGEPRAPRGSPRNILLVLDDRRMIFPADLFRNRRNVRADALLSALVFVEWNVQAKAPF